MEYRIDKKSGNKLSALGMGCMRLPGNFGSPDIKKSEAVIMEAINKGINFFDTAYIYPGSETALGTIVANNKVREKIYIATKLPLFKCHKYEDFDTLLNTQLKRLQTHYIDYYFMHNITKFHDWQRVVALGIEKWLQEKQQAGIIKHVGFSFHGQRHEFPMLIDAYDWGFCMIQYNYINVNFQAGEAGLKYAASKDIPVFIMEPLLGGRLVDGLPKAAQEVFSKENTNTPVAWALNWLWNQPEVTMVLSGMNSIEQIQENTALATAAKPLTPQEQQAIATVAEIFTASYKIPCTGCNYCLPCPKKINIPDTFMAYNTSYAIGRVAGLTQYATTCGALSRGFSVTDCTRCGKCEKACPQEIAIMDRLVDVKKRIEPWWFRAIVGVARQFMK